MLTPHWMYESFLPIDVKQKMAMIAGGACGVMTTVGGLLLLKRRLLSPRVRATTTGADILILSLLMVQCALGLLTIPFSAQHMDGSEMMKLVGWAQSVVTFHGGASQHLDGVAFIFRVHGAGHDPVPAVPVLPSGSYLERAGRIPDAQIPDCPRPSLTGPRLLTDPAAAGFFRPSRDYSAAANRISIPPSNCTADNAWWKTR